MEAITIIRSRTVVMPTKDIDTDQIIPARFLTTISREGLGKFLFNDLRLDDQGRINKDFVLNQPDASGCEILVGGNNFGCGSSREHAPWALLDYGFKAVVSTEIADIFTHNSLKNGFLPIVVDTDTHTTLLEHPGMEITIDLAMQKLTLDDGTAVKFPIDAFSRDCLLQGIDQLGYLQQQLAAIEKFEESRSWKP
ncbi:MAG: 3-isopropylmalate dehydratase small subunit [Proteobacteria bacterium]|nr:3-isopropylmalate dehydratase small subunit [Pseudomonadota bacterium]